MMPFAKNDRGATALIVAISMLVLMGFAALVVDVGAGFNERAQDQSAADSGALAGALDLQAGWGEVRDQALAYVRSNLPTTYGDPANLYAPEWIALWETANCTDPDRPGDYVPVPPAPGMTSTDIDCVSIRLSAEGDTVRVRVPNQIVAASFGKVLGITELSTYAPAEATQNAVSDGGALPLGVFRGSEAGTEQCLKETTSGQSTNLPPPCDTAGSNGNFGPLDPIVASDPSSPAYCSSTETTFRFSLAAGIDHGLSVWLPIYDAGNTTDVQRLDECTGNNPQRPTLAPNTMQKGPGVSAGDLADGLLFGVSKQDLNAPGRLVVPTSEATILGFPVENRPLWDYLIDSNWCNFTTNTPEFKTAEFLACLQGWKSNVDGVIFSDTIAQNKRFAYIPQYDELSPDDPLCDKKITDPTDPHCPAGGASDVYHFNFFRPVYLQSVIVKNGNSYVVHRPGEKGSFSGGGNSAIKALSSILLDCRMFSDDVCPSTSGSDPSGTTAIRILLLSK